MPKEKRRESSFFLYDVGKLELNPLFSEYKSEIVIKKVDLFVLLFHSSHSGEKYRESTFLMKNSVYIIDTFPLCE